LAIARELEAEIARALADARRGERLREGLVVAIAGPPNAGKSTLLNRIARREAAIVSPYAGTTRDVIEVHLDLDGWPVTLLDTAGIRETEDPVEREGVRRAEARAAAADLVLWVVDASAEAGAFQRGEGAPAVWRVNNKIDLVAGRDESNVIRRRRNELVAQDGRAVNKGLSGRTESESNNSEYVFSLSATSGEGVDALVDALAEFAGQILAGAEPALVSRERQRRALEDTLAALRRASTRPAAESEDLLAEELRLASRGLGRLTGRIDVEDVLDVIFRDFCIGK
jgi:tRNA modification GTPase